MLDCVFDREVKKMDYKGDLVRIIEGIDNEKLLEYLYTFVKGFIEKFF